MILQSLQTEYDKMENRVEEEKEISKQLRSDLRQTVDDLAEQKVLVAELAEERESLIHQLEEMEKEQEVLY